MATRYTVPSVEAIQEDSEDEMRDESRAKEAHSRKETSYHQSRSSLDGGATSTVSSNVRERERPKRKHRSKEGGTKHQSKSQGKHAMKRTNGLQRDNGFDGQRSRHRRTYSSRSTSSTSSSEDDEPVQDHREVLAAARAKLTSPSMISTFTSLTTSTNKSSGSSGSNSTVTQASVTKRSSIGKRSDILEAPLSPAVPDPPDVFTFLDNGSVIGATREEDDNDERRELDQDQGLEAQAEEHAKDLVEEDEEEDEEENEEREGEAVIDEGQDEDDEEEEQENESQWLPDERELYDESTLPPHLSPHNVSIRDPPSASSSFHGSDQFSEPTADNDTDRSTSPERSVKDHASESERGAAPTDRASTRMASQMAAAHQRQNFHGSMQSFGTSGISRGNAPLPSTALSPRQNQHMQHSLPRVEKLPVTGYELLASRLSSYNSPSEFDDGTVIKPMYRKFGALNHRLLLHLQDELSELEEQLHRLDHADTQSRRAGVGGRVIPASRRAAAMHGGELQWHKTDVLGKIGFKLAQYNQALSSFNTTQSLSPPAPTDIDTYREYLSTEHPIAEAETHFLDPSDDLVSICSSAAPHSASTSSDSYSQPLSRSESQDSSSPTILKPMVTHPIITNDHEPHSQLQGLAAAIAVAVLVPILTFNVIPGFIGRVTVIGLVASGVVFALMQAGVLGKGCFGREGLVCGGIYGGVMIVLAGMIA